MGHPSSLWCVLPGGSVFDSRSTRQGMAIIEGNLWEHNLVRLIVLDVSSDYELMRDPMPPFCYPVLTERWVLSAELNKVLPQDGLVSGYLYDWHEAADQQDDAFYVGMVRSELAQTLLAD